MRTFVHEQTSAGELKNNSGNRTGQPPKDQYPEYIKNYKSVQNHNRLKRFQTPGTDPFQVRMCEWSLGLWSYSIAVLTWTHQHEPARMPPCWGRQDCKNEPTRRQPQCLRGCGATGTSHMARGCASWHHPSGELFAVSPERDKYPPHGHACTSFPRGSLRQLNVYGQQD